MNKNKLHQNRQVTAGLKKQEKNFLSAHEFLKMVLPIGIICLMYGVTTTLPNVYPQGYEMKFYPVFLLACLACLIALTTSACFVPRLRDFMVHYSYLIVFSFIVIEFLDILTLKTGFFILPFAPSPDKILSVFPNSFGSLFDNLVASLLLLGQGVAIGMISGFITGILIGWSKIANYWFSPLLKIIGPLPSAAWLPIAVTVMPSTRLAGVLLICIALWFPLSLMLSSAIRSTDKRKIDAARVMGASESYILFHVALPSAVPSIFNALFMGFCSSFTALIVAEQLGVKAGLGWYINWASGWGEYNKVFCAVGVFIIMFYLIITILFKVRDHSMKWQKSIVRW